MTITEDRADCIRQLRDAHLHLSNPDRTETTDSAVAGMKAAKANLDRYAGRYLIHLLDPEGDEKAGKTGTSTLQGGQR